MICINCKKKKFKKIADIGNQVISSVFHEKKEGNKKKYCLDLYKCNTCDLVQLKELAPLNDMYGFTYGYRTSLSPVMINHIKKKYFKLLKNKFLKRKTNILDIGSNDGTFLNFFPTNKKYNLFGIDPSAEKFIKFYKKGIDVIYDFFSEKTINEYLNKKEIKNKKFSLITSFAMFYDLKDPNSFCEQINSLLEKNGVWMVEISYFPLLLQNLTYDQICHEHVAYYTLSTFTNILKKNNLKVLDFELNEVHGGSIEITCAKKNSHHKPSNKKIEKIISLEKNIDNYSYKKFNSRIRITKDNLICFLKILKKTKKSIIGYGASTKANIVLNHCKIDNKLLKYICDANTEKHNKYTPGSNIKIISKNKIQKLKPDYILVLIWAIKKEVIKQELKYIKSGGTLVFHLPKFHFINKENYQFYLAEKLETLSYNI